MITTMETDYSQDLEGNKDDHRDHGLESDDRVHKDPEIRQLIGDDKLRGVNLGNNLVLIPRQDIKTSFNHREIFSEVRTKSFFEV